MGVLVAFAAGAFATLSLCLISIAKHYFELFTFFGCLSLERRKRRGEGSTAIRREKKIPWIDGVIQDLVLNLSDQQVVTGLALSLSIRYSFKLACEVSAYHYNIVANLILMTMCTHVCSIMVLPDYFRNPALAFVRILGIGAIVAFSGLLFVNQQTVSGIPIAFPTNVPEIGVPLNENDTASVALLLPAACYQSESTTLLNSLKNSFQRPGGIANELKQSVSNGRFKNGYSQWILLTLMYSIGVITGIAQRLLKINEGDSSKYRYTRKFIWCIKLVVVGFGIYVSVATFDYIRKMREWLDHTNWYEDEDGENPENDLFTFGQLIPVLLLALFGIALLESAYGRWREWKDHHRSTGHAGSNGHTYPLTTNPQHKYNSSYGSPA